MAHMLRMVQPFTTGAAAAVPAKKLSACIAAASSSELPSPGHISMPSCSDGLAARDDLRSSLILDNVRGRPLRHPPIQPQQLHRHDLDQHDHRHLDASCSLDAPFPPFLPSEVYQLQDPAARAMASRIQRLPVQTSLTTKPIMTSCVQPLEVNKELPPLLLLHGFDSSCLEWRNTFPRLEEANMECWAVDILGWGFSHSEKLISAGVAAKREHLYQFWRTYIRRPVILVGSSLGGATALDFCLAHPEAVSKMVLINANGYAEGTGKMTLMPKVLAYAGVSLLKSVVLRTYAYFLIYHKIKLRSALDQMKVGRLHCCMPGWADSSVDFMLSGGYNVASRVPEITKETLIIWGLEDKILPQTVPQRFKKDLANSKLVYVQSCGHLPHVEKPMVVTSLILEYLKT